MGELTSDQQRQVKDLIKRLRRPIRSLNGVIARLENLGGPLQSPLRDAGGTLGECLLTAEDAAGKVLTICSLSRVYGQREIPDGR